jgi:hypothetical protein
MLSHDSKNARQPSYASSYNSHEPITKERNYNEPSRLRDISLNIATSQCLVRNKYEV